MGYRISQQDKQLLQEVYAFILEDLSRELTRDVLCKKFGLNRMKLYKGFVMLYGVRLSAFILQQRMELARRLLVTTDKPIKEVALLAGYRNVKSFHRTFRHTCGSTPLLVRNNDT